MGSAAASNTFLPGLGTDSLLMLTAPGSGGQAGSAYAPAPLLLDFNAAFEIRFRFFVAHGSVLQGDGLTFFMTGSDPAPGTGGSDLGYGGSGMNGYAFAVDTFNFEDEPEAVSVQILGDGDASPIVYTETGLGDIQPPEYSQWQAQVNYTPSGFDDEAGDLTFAIHQPHTGQTYTVELDDAAWGAVAIDLYDEDENYLGRGVHIGFTAGNGLADDGHFIGSLTPIPEPSSWALLLAGLGVVGQLARRRGPR
ncbi:MAG: PEPxxWA-CTERM sorting domain-containing protein [Burkholderiales bacterium]|nr:PEPxxWA-CTERM sorting domain-containing protein [Burkholderiales bacterium]